ncbi:MAG: EAL domain-containing protein [Deltaproteobacteria bacterium]|nr:EAL domain-containing protein [Deltaproteobacteria bacterium]
MKLTEKIVLAVALTFAVLSLALYGLSHSIFLGGYERIEREDTARNVSRALSAFQADLNSISSLNVDWASWDDTYGFIVSRNPAYIDSTLNDETLAKQRLNLVVYLDSAGKTVFAKAFQYITMRESPMPSDMASHLAPGSPLAKANDVGVSGVVVLKDGLLMVTAHPILTSEGKGPSRGTLIMGRFLDHDEISYLSDTIHMPLSLLPFANGRTALAGNNDIEVRPVDSRTVEGFGVVRDIYGTPAGILRIELPRDIYNQGKAGVSYFIIYLIVAALVAAIAIMAILEKKVLSRLKSLGRTVSGIGVTGDLASRVPSEGNDEISDLTKEINRMLVSLEVMDSERREAKDKLKEANEELEERVAERTADLSDANLALKDEIAERTRMENIIREMAYRDNLTGLPNRSLFMDRLTQVLTRGARHRTIAGVLFMDLDRFKVINDTLGHTTGDELIRMISIELQKLLRSGDTVARMGGDEFTVLLQDLSRTEDVAVVVEKILDAFKKPIRLAGQEVFVSFSIGVSMYPDDGADPATLLKNADIAMYHAKGKGGNTWQMYDGTMAEKAFERLTIGNKLRTALDKHEFVLYYQPQVDLKTMRISGAEALIRWQDPEKGLVMPGSFIPIAEETGIIVPMGEWGLRMACVENKELQGRGFADLSVAVNVSARMFTNEGFVAMVKGVLKNTGLEARFLKLEITESILMTNLALAMEVMKELRAIGIQFAIDDFGTGYSSLGYLKSLPINQLKIDKSFVRDISTDLDDRLIVTAIIKLAQSLKLEVLAEGVETEDQLEFLSGLQCDKIQGYLFSKPLPKESFRALLMKNA